MTSLALDKPQQLGSRVATVFGRQLLTGISRRLRPMIRVNDITRTASVSGYVLVSLGNRHWTLSMVKRVLESASRFGCALDWYLLDAAEEASLVVLQGFDRDAAARAVIGQSFRIRDMLRRAGVSPGRIHLASSLGALGPFETTLSQVQGVYADNPRFARAVRNQVFSNLQPKLRRVGIVNNRDPRLEDLVDYLLREIAIKGTLAAVGSSIEFALKPEMPVWSKITQGEFSGLDAFGELTLRHETIASEDDGPPLELDGLSYKAGGRPPIGAAPRSNELNDISFAAKGVVAIVGPSGAGKTTLLRAIAGHIPIRGTIRLNGEDVSAWPAEQRGIVTVFQDFGLFPHLTGLQNALEGAHRLFSRSKDERLWSAARYLRDLGIEHCASRLPRQMSGGEQQRVAIARALMAEPELLLLDEPTAALDQLQREGLQGIIRRLRVDRPDLPIILVSHDLNFAFSVADRVGVMDGGRLLAFGKPSALLAHPESLRVAQILGEHNIVRGVIGADGVFTAGGSLALLIASGAVRAGPCIALIPHDAVILAASGGGTPATIMSLASIGSTVRLSLCIDEDTVLVGATLRRLLPEALDVGSAVHISIAPDAISFLQG